MPLLGSAKVIIATGEPEDAPEGFRVVAKGHRWIKEIEDIIREERGRGR